MWHLDVEHQEALLQGELAARAHMHEPELGLDRIVWRSQQLPATLLSLKLCALQAKRAPLSDFYVRGTDVVITYGTPPSDKTLRPQIYWRSLDEDSGRGIEFVLSIETDLLDSNPEASVSSWLPGSAAHQHTTSAGWQRITEAGQRIDTANSTPIVVIQNDDWLYAEMIYPSDFTQATIQRSNDGWQTSWNLFPEHLEKGVIRRARLRGMFFSADCDLSATLEALERFQNSPLPLTT